MQPVWEGGVRKQRQRPRVISFLALVCQPRLGQEQQDGDRGDKTGLWTPRHECGVPGVAGEQERRANYREVGSRHDMTLDKFLLISDGAP